jgi:hypothetical protein
MKTFSNLSAAMLALILLGAAPTLAPAPAQAQALVATVNDDPITTYDLDQRIKLQKILKKYIKYHLLIVFFLELHVILHFHHLLNVLFQM